jgi:hypothetical protein
VETPQRLTHRFRKQVIKSLSTNENSRIVPTENMGRIPTIRVDRGRTEVVWQRAVTPAVVGFTSINHYILFPEACLELRTSQIVHDTGCGVLSPGRFDEE